MDGSDKKEEEVFDGMVKLGEAMWKGGAHYGRGQGEEDIRAAYRRGLWSCRVGQ